jgi:hypothetical protein
LIGGGGFITGLFLLLLAIGGNKFVLELFQESSSIYFILGPMAFFALMTYSMTRKWMPFVRLAEKVFRALKLPNPSSIDLVKTSKAQRTDKDPGEFGTFYFRY